MLLFVAIIAALVEAPLWVILLFAGMWIAEFLMAENQKEKDSENLQRIADSLDHE